MKKLFLLLQLFLFITFNFFLFIAALQLIESPSTIYRLDKNAPRFTFKEAFNPSLIRLNTVGKLAAYCDSLYREKAYADKTIKFEEIFPQITSEAIRNRFYHGYSSYSYNNNFMAVFLSGLSIKGLNAIVVPDDILKYPYAACSQQSIVMMEILQRKGFSTRKVGFQGKKTGHFCFEVYYNGGWHFCDPDMEPDARVLNAYNRPTIQFLAQHRDILLKAYHQYPPEQVLDIFPNYFYGPINSFAAPKAIIFQKVTKFFSYTLWLFFFLAFILARRKYLQLIRQNYVRNSRIHLPRIQPGASSAYYPNYSA